MHVQEPGSSRGMILAMSLAPGQLFLPPRFLPIILSSKRRARGESPW